MSFPEMALRDRPSLRVPHKALRQAAVTVWRLHLSFKPRLFCVIQRWLLRRNNLI
jgi:hypothetical protein